MITNTALNTRASRMGEREFERFKDLYNAGIVRDTQEFDRLAPFVRANAGTRNAYVMTMARQAGTGVLSDANMSTDALDLGTRGAVLAWSDFLNGVGPLPGGGGDDGGGAVSEAPREVRLAPAKDRGPDLAVPGPLGAKNFVEDPRYAEANVWNNIFCYGKFDVDDATVRYAFTPAFLQKYRTTKELSDTFKISGKPGQTLGFVKLWARAAELGCDVTVSAPKIADLWLPPGPESAEAHRRLCRAFGVDESVVKLNGKPLADCFAKP